MPAAARVTIQDVARAAGVRASTVSKALNGGRGSTDVRRRVEEAASRLGYRPNAQARGLRRAETRSLGLLVPDLANPGFLPFVRGAQRAADERGYVVLIADGRRSDQAETAALDRFLDQGVDGLLLAGPVPEDGLAPFLDHGVPVVPSAEHHRDFAALWSRSESAATREMARRLLVLGHRRFALVTTRAPKGAPGVAYRRSRFAALASELSAAGAALSVTLVEPGDDADTLAPALRAAARGGGAAVPAAGAGAVAPTALVCANQLLAPWLLRVLNEDGLRLPSDVSLVVYGDSDWARAHLPALSVVSRDVDADGYHLAMSLLDGLAERLDEERPLPSPARFVERGSIGPAG